MSSNAMSRSLDPDRQHVSPLGQGTCHAGEAGIQVKVLKWPDEKTFKSMVCKAITATRGNDIEFDEIDEAIIEDAFKGGLNQCLEWDTVVFEISGVSRGLTHELVRTRKASFAQQSMRHTDMGDPNVRMPKSIYENEETQKIWLDAIANCADAYIKLVEMDIPFQDARTVLPIATETYIIASYPLGEFLNTYAYRACPQMYPEIVALFRKMKIALTSKCLWLEPYIKISCERNKQCTFQGWEEVEGSCPFPWAKESERQWKSKKFNN